MKEHLLHEMLKFAYDSSKGWKTRFDELGIKPSDIEEEEDLAKIPVLKKEQLQILQHDLYPFNSVQEAEVRRAVRIYMTSGPIYHHQLKEADDGHFVQALEAAGFHEGDVVLNSFPYHLSPFGWMLDEALRSMGCTVVPAGMDHAEKQLKLIKDCRITGYVGKPSFLAHLLSNATEQDLETLSMDKVFLSMEMLPPGLRKRLEGCGIQVSEGYATSVTGCLAYQCGKEIGWKIRDSVVLQICDPTTGSPIYNQDIGEIVVTVLDKYRPLIRYGTGDLSRWVEGKLGERIDGILGKVGDGIKVGEVFVYYPLIHKVLKVFPEIHYYQGIVSNNNKQDVLTIRLESSNESESFKDLVSKRLRDSLRITPNIEVVPRGMIDRSQKQLMDVRPKKS